MPVLLCSLYASPACHPNVLKVLVCNTLVQKSGSSLLCLVEALAVAQNGRRWRWLPTRRSELTKRLQKLSHTSGLIRREQNLADWRAERRTGLDTSGKQCICMYMLN